MSDKPDYAPKKIEPNARAKALGLTSDFSIFMQTASPEEMERVLLGVLRKANEDQRRFMESA